MLRINHVDHSRIWSMRQTWAARSWGHTLTHLYYLENEVTNSKDIKL